MRYLETAIRDAVEEGGYQPHMHGFKKWKSFTFKTAQAFVTSQGIDCILLDATFWQALGKARGWTEGDYTDPNTNWHTHRWEGEWESNWHRLIDHLASGKDVESFFKELSGKEKGV